MQDAVTEHVDAPPAAGWDLVADVTQTHRYSEETFEAEWLDGATGPGVGVRFRGHVKRNGRGPPYWTVCRITACEPAVRALGESRQYGADGGTDVTESFRLPATVATRVYWALAGWARGRTNRANMRTTLRRIKAVVESGEG